MNDHRASLSRRGFLGVAGAAGALAAGGGLSDVLAARKAPALLQGSGKLTYWGGLIFSDEANQLLVDTIKAWGKDNGVETDVVMINENETSQKVSAAVESGTMPDALDLGIDLLLLLSASNVMQPLDDLYDTIGSAHGGWFESIANVVNPALLGGSRTGVPYAGSGNVLFSRKDALEAAGFTPPPKTWQELSEMAEAAQEPPLYGMGFALSNVGDGNLQMSVMQSFGGRIADDEGKTCTIASDETRTYLEWITGCYEKGLFPPGSTTWDGAGDNTAYLSGQAIFIANPGSVKLAMDADDPELGDATSYSALPAGPVAQISPISAKVRGIPNTTQDVDRAKALIEHLANPEFLSEYYKVAIYGPALKAHADFDAFKDVLHAGLLDLVENGTAPAYPDVFNTAYADVSNNFLIPKMIQRIVIDGKPIDDAMREAQEQGQAIYDKYK